MAADPSKRVVERKPERLAEKQRDEVDPLALWLAWQPTGGKPQPAPVARGR